MQKNNVNREKSMKNKIVKLASFLIMAIVLLCLIGGKNSAKAATWKNDGGQWYKGNKVIYIANNVLYESPFGPHSMGIRKKIASWQVDDSCESPRIVTIYNDNVYVRFCKTAGKAALYSVNIKTKKKRKVAVNCSAFASSGKYIYGNTFHVSDTGAYPVQIWKISGNTVKKGKMIGKYIFGTTIVKKKLYYASYPTSKQKKMTVYCCNLNGTHRKKLFTLKGSGKYCQVLLRNVTKKTIKATVSGTGKAKEYEYNIKTKKLKRK